jgi:hypothetical protein
MTDKWAESDDIDTKAPSKATAISLASVDKAITSTKSCVMLTCFAVLLILFFRIFSGLGFVIDGLEEELGLCTRQKMPTWFVSFDRQRLVFAPPPRS